jgi:hypothetical protein
VIRYVVLLTFKADVDHRAVDALLAAAPEIFSDTPFVSVAHGPGLGLLPGGADWGYAGDLRSAEDIPRWREHPAHIRLRELVLPMIEHMSHIQLALD